MFIEASLLISLFLLALLAWALSDSNLDMMVNANKGSRYPRVLIPSMIRAVAYYPYKQCRRRDIEYVRVQVPRLKTRIFDLSVDQKLVEKLQAMRVCHDNDEATGDAGNLHSLNPSRAMDSSRPFQFVPFMYFHIAAFPLLIRLTTLKEFPFSVMGGVHLRSRITQFQSIHMDQLVDLHVRLFRFQPHRKGTECVFMCEVFENGTTSQSKKFWEERISLLFFHKRNHEVADLIRHEVGVFFLTGFWIFIFWRGHLWDGGRVSMGISVFEMMKSEWRLDRCCLV